MKIHCKNCTSIIEIERDKDAPDGSLSMGCNWCPNCPDEPQEYYVEWYNFEEQETIDPDQVSMFDVDGF